MAEVADRRHHGKIRKTIFETLLKMSEEGRDETRGDDEMRKERRHHVASQPSRRQLLTRRVINC